MKVHTEIRTHDINAISGIRGEPLDHRGDLLGYVIVRGALLL